MFLPHGNVPASLFVTYSLQSLLAILSFFIARHEPVVKNRMIFLNFGLFFAMSFFGHISNFVGTIISLGSPYAKAYFDQYFCFAAYFFLLALSIVYLSLDTIFREKHTILKYAASLAIVGSFFLYYYQPYLTDPQYGYRTPDLRDWVTLDRAVTSMNRPVGSQANASSLAQRTVMYEWASDGSPVRELERTEKENRIAQILPYLDGDNFLILVWKPMMLNSIRMSVVCIVFIMLFFGFQYFKDPPQGAYIEKIVFLMLVFCSMEILHAWSTINLLAWEEVSSLINVGQYVSVAVLGFITVFFFLRLHFITSVKGEFYEQELAARPGAITRWRDTLDNMVIEKFFDRKALLGRMFIDPRTGGGPKQQNASHR
jgi:hypothetical protein